MIVPKSICDNLLLSHVGGEGLLLCNKDERLLEELKTKILFENQKALIRYRKLHAKRRSKLILGFTVALVICILIVFEKDIIPGEAYRWPFNIAATMLMGGCLYFIFMSYVTIGQLRGAGSLADDLDLILLHRDIRENFQC